MRLEKIVLDGFKSFADKTEFTFSNQITAIVGPNGCGKSNVVDALKWVLGEQSTKSLRSGQMADVIFSGSMSRKSAGRAEVSLFFSEAQGVGIEQGELQITRRLYRSGDSEYLINNKPSRLKDVKELFMDTGIGVKAYSIIEQGQIAQLLTASKTDRRAIFEEAAGISKYKAQKKEALRKLDRTEQNILRLADIVGEVQKQLRSVKLQAGKARNYLEYSDRLKGLRVSFSLAQYDEFTKNAADKKLKLAGFEDSFAEIVAGVSEDEATLSSLGVEIVEKEVEINRCDNSLVAVTGKIEQSQQRIEFLKHRISELSERKESETEQIADIEKRFAGFETQMAEAKTDLQEIEVLTNEKAGRVDELQDSLNEINFTCSQIDTELQDEKSGIIDIVRKTAQLHNELQSINVYRDNLNGQKERINGRINQTENQLETLLGQKAQNKARLEDINKVIAQLQQSLEDKRSQIKLIDDDATKVNENLSGCREHRSAIQSELGVLSDMESKREGVNTAVKDILDAAAAEGKDFIDCIVADAIEAEAEYASAIEAALVDRADAIIVSDSNWLMGDSDLVNIDSGRVKFVCADMVGPFSNNIDLSGIEGVLGRAIEFVKYAPRHSAMLWSMLGKIIVVDSIITAKRLYSRFRNLNCSFVTVDGQRIGVDGTISAGAFGKSGGLISRKSRIVELEAAIGDVVIKIKEYEEKLAADSVENAHLEKLCQDFRTSIYEASTEKTNVASELNVIDQNVNRLTQEQPILKGEVDALEKQVSESVQKEYKSKQALEELEIVNTQRNARIEELEGQLVAHRESQEVVSDELMGLKISLGQANEKKKAAIATIDSLNSQIEHGQSTMASAKATIEACAEQIEESNDSILNTENEISEFFSQKDTFKTDSVRLHEEVDEMVEVRNVTDERLKVRRSEQAGIDEKIHELKVDLSQLDVKITDLIQRVTEELDMDLVAEYENYAVEDTNWDEVKNEMKELRGKIERLGNVNVDAIDQLNELEERNEFLSSQIEDLNASKNQLNQLIAKLNKESLNKFVATFEEVRKNFQIVFRKLFGGGKADIIMDNPDDMLESGIEVVARPPGKETRSISLLSGGEKTMTAIAMLFAIFQTKPSPFCFLDEVDAALDEANNERFNLIVQDFKKYSQFVIITHAKRTMSIADVLYGVTMQQKGVSKRISVSFDKFDTDEPTEDETVAVA